MTAAILQEYGFRENSYTINAFGTGLINNTWVVEHAGKKFILQRINQNVFKTPDAIDDNIQMLSVYLRQHYQSYIFTVPVSTITGNTLVTTNDGAFRMFEFVHGSKTYDVLQKPQQAFEAAKQFGRFTKLLSDFDALGLKITLPEFHNLTLRYQQFENAVQAGNKERIVFAVSQINILKNYKYLVEIFEKIKLSTAFKQRVTHHDTKISNVLFDEHDKGICVIDLDTVMPGYFISDVGDMLRTYLSAAGEEETDLTKVAVRDEYFKAVMQGYLSEMKDELSLPELDAFVYAGEFMIYMQALRFLTDYLNNDVYYGAKYPLQNFNRTNNQIALLEDLVGKEKFFSEMVRTMRH